jgi:hypothetical protein
MIFYYWWRKIQQLGLASECKNEQSPIGTWLKHLFGLTFLPPAEVGDSFAEDFMCEKPENSKLDQFADYLVDNYTDSESKFPPEIWAENSCSILRTTNTCESFHSKFKRENSSPYPNIHCNEVTKKRSRWRKNSVLSSSLCRKLARSQLP